MAADLGPTLRDVMRQVAATVCVISFADDTGPDGITVSSFTSVSLDPPTVLFCVNHAASVYDRLRRVSRYCVNVLNADQADVSQFFAVGTPQGFSVSWQTVDGVPTVTDAQSRILCDAQPVMPMGTHDVFFGRVTAVRVRDGMAPLIYLNGGYVPVGV